MKQKLFILLLSVLSLTAFGQKKTVAVLDPICRDNSVNTFYRQMVRGAMETAVTASDEYEAYDRAAFDQIQKEQKFQREGAVNDSQIKKMGEMAGVDYVLVSEVSAYEGYLSAIVKILNVTTGKYDKSADDYAQLSPDGIKTKCKEMATSLFGALPSTPSKQIPAGYVDLGLPSGTLWKAQNEDCGLITYDQAYNFYGNRLPTKEQLQELKDNCLWTWQGNGYEVKGRNGESIFLPAAGDRDCDGSTYSVGKYGFYWSSTPHGEYAWLLYCISSDVSMDFHKRCFGRSVRLVK